MFFATILVIIIILAILLKNGYKLYPRLFLAIVVFLILAIPMGLRDISYAGVDTIVYANDFHYICKMNGIIEAMTIQNKDYGFYALAFLFSRICKNVNIWILMCSSIYIFAVIRLIYKYSDDMCFSILMFVFYEYYLYNFQLMRHVLSLAFVILAYDQLINKRKIKFVIFILVATSMNAMALCFIPAYLLIKPKIDWKQWIWIIVGTVGIMILSNKTVWSGFIMLLTKITRSARYLTYANPKPAGRITFLFQLVFVFITWFVIENYHVLKDNNIIDEIQSIIVLKREKMYLCKNRNINLISNNYNLLVNLASIGAIFYFGRIIIGESYRIAQFYSVFSIILVPNIIKKIKNKFLKLLLIIGVLGFGCFHFFSIYYSEVSMGVYNPYIFFR